MLFRDKKYWRYFGTVTLALLCVPSISSAVYVLPRMGGGSVGEFGGAPMKHADVSFDGSFHVAIDSSVATPVLRALTPPEEFDPSKPWDVLTDTSHNFQYGWNRGFPFSVPFTANIWIEQTDASPGLEVFQRPPAPGPTYSPIFGTDGSSTRWRWNGSMTHNVYSVTDPTESSYFASYRIYIGDAAGEALAGYGEASTTFWFAAEVPLVGDYDDDGEVTSDDYALWVSQFGQTGEGLAADGDGDGTVTAADYTIWRDALPVAEAAAIPEPAAVWLLALGLVVGIPKRRCIDGP